MVIEDGESEQSPEVEESEDNRSSVDLDMDPDQLVQSPGGGSQASQMSGTTVQTSNSVAESRDLDPQLVEYLPDLFESSKRILDLLAPPNASTNIVNSIVRELKVLGSARAKRLNHHEGRFELDREHYGSGHYIDSSIVQAALFGKQKVDIDNFRPDPILHAANLAALIKGLLVTQKESQGIKPLLETIDTFFPRLFLREFDSTVRCGNSLLQDKTFELSLDIRTQYAIASLLALRESENYNPDDILLSAFFTADREWVSTPDIPYFEDVMINGELLHLMQKDNEISREQIHRILFRINEIRSAFQQLDETVESGDWIDFERLDEMYPWSDFLTLLVQWCRLRFDEIVLCIRQQGGVDYMVEMLVEAVNKNNSQVDLNYEAPSPIMKSYHPPPAQAVIPATAGQEYVHSPISTTSFHFLLIIRGRTPLFRH
jgi:hypothetical protein